MPSDRSRLFILFTANPVAHLVFDVANDGNIDCPFFVTMKAQ
jgi:hypothetical protein